MDVSPSILDVKVVPRWKCRFHVDVMDGKFVKNTTSIPLTLLKHMPDPEVHLMMVNPEKLIPLYKKAGAKVINFHVEINKTKKLLTLCKKHNLRSSLVLNPETSVKKLFPYLKTADEFLIMSVHPGRSGQKFIPAMLKKIKALRAKTKKIIKVDGGINANNILKVKEAGADIAVVGSAIFSSSNPYSAFKKLKALAK